MSTLSIQEIEAEATSGDVKYFVRFWKDNLNNLDEWLDQGLNPNLRKDGTTLLGAAIIYGAPISTIGKLLDLGARDATRLKIDGRVYFDALTESCSRGDVSLELTRYLINRGHDVNGSITGVSPLQKCLKRHFRNGNALKTFKLLIDNEANLFISNIRMYRTPYQLMFSLALADCIEIIDNLNELNDYPDTKNHPFYLIFNYTGDYDIPKRRVLYFKYKDSFGFTPDKSRIIYSGLFSKKTTSSQYKFIFDIIGQNLNIKEYGSILSYISKNEVLTKLEVMEILSDLPLPPDINDINWMTISSLSLSVIEFLVNQGINIYDIVQRISLYPKRRGNKFFQIIDYFDLDLNVHIRYIPRFSHRQMITTLAQKIYNTKDLDICIDGYIRGADYIRLLEDLPLLTPNVVRNQIPYVPVDDIIGSTSLSGLALRSIKLNKINIQSLPRAFRW